MKIDHRGHRDHRGGSDGTVALATRMGRCKKITSSSKLASFPFFPQQSQQAGIIHALPSNLTRYARRSLRLLLKSEMTPAFKNNFFLCALCVLCGQSLFPLA